MCLSGLISVTSSWLALPITGEFLRIRLHLDPSTMLNLTIAFRFSNIPVSSQLPANERDKQDIETCTIKFKLTKNQVNSRAKKVQYAGNEDVYSSNLKYVLENFFSPRDAAPNKH